MIIELNPKIIPEISNITNDTYSNTSVNDSLFLQAHPKCPWQGYKDSGYGSCSIYDFVRVKHISLDQGYIPSLHPKSFWWYPYKGKARSFHALIEVIFKDGIKEKAKATFQTIIDFLR